VLSVPAGEASKSFAELERLLDRMLEFGLERGSQLLALGGGVVGDLAGFASAIALRGIDYLQLPTSLLAQFDSSVGGKTAVNMRAGKNLVGAFHQPRLVLADIDTLKTLPERERRAGLCRGGEARGDLRPRFLRLARAPRRLGDRRRRRRADRRDRA